MENCDHNSEAQEDEWDLHDCYTLSHSALARDWERPEEDEAWAHLRSDAQSFPASANKG